MNGLGEGAPEPAHQGNRHEDQADGEEDLVEFAGTVEAGVEGAFKCDADQCNDDKRGEEREGEGHGVGVHECYRDVATGHREYAVREVDETHQAHGDRQAYGDDVEDHRVSEAMEEDGGQGFHYWGCCALGGGSQIGGAPFPWPPPARGGGEWGQHCCWGCASLLVIDLLPWVFHHWDCLDLGIL